MNPLEQIKDRLKVKPVISQPQEEFGVVLPAKQPVGEEVVNPPTVRDERDVGFDRKALQERLTERKLQTVRLQFPAPTEKKVLRIAPVVAPRSRVIPVSNKLLLEEDSDAEEEEDKEEEQDKEAKAVYEAEDELEEEIKKAAAAIRKKEKTSVDQSSLKPAYDPKTRGVVLLDEKDWVEFGEGPLDKKLPKRSPQVNLKVSSYYMNNREIFVNFMNTLLEPYKQIMESDTNLITCENIGQGSENVQLLTHQLLVRDYMNLYTPYRGLLLFHGLGSGKTCTSIAIAEGMKEKKRIIVMTPASLKKNYMEELKKCGDLMFKKNQYWEWIPTEGKSEEQVKTLASVLNLPVEYIRRKRGAWLVDVSKRSNYAGFETTDKKNLDDQLDEMIRSKYTFINYNGLTRKRFADLSSNFERNIFDNCVVIIDEAHNFISRIVNKIEKEKEIPMNNRGEKERLSRFLSVILYEQLLRAENCRIVLLTGTPIINYPNELAILFNLLRGYIKTWEIPLTVKSKEKINTESLRRIFFRENSVDFIDYTPSSQKLLITKNPIGFANYIKKDSGYQGVTNEMKGIANVDDSAFERHIIGILKSNDIEVIGANVKIHNYTALPEKIEPFLTRFIDSSTKQIKNIDQFKRRIIGLTSYFRSAQEDLLPKYEKTPQYHHIVKIPMSDYQFYWHEMARQSERESEKKGKSSGFSAEGIYIEPVSTYRIFSRLFCNFAMPTPPGRPMPKAGISLNKEEEALKKEKVGAKEGEVVNQLATLLETANKEAKREQMENDAADDMISAEEAEPEAENVLDKIADKSYPDRIKEALDTLRENAATNLSEVGLQTYSPKMLAILQNITNRDHRGLHLVYSQFRTMEGIGIFSMVLDANGFTQFKIKKTSSGLWQMDIKPEDRGKPTYALYTGTESAEEKEIVRNIYNGQWDYIPTDIAEHLRGISNNNNMGEVVKVFMITSSGSEGINLRNTRYVHIMEPYWHPVRTEQVIGRARRICSHKDLPLPLQTVEVFIYLMTFTETQRTGTYSRELVLHDMSKREPKVPQTSDEYLYEICVIKEEVSGQLIKAIKETSVDCSVYSKNSKEDLRCIAFADPPKSAFSYTPNIDNQQSDVIASLNKRKIEWTGKPVTIQGIQYVARKMDSRHYNIYDLESYNSVIESGDGEPRSVGTLEIKPDGKKVFNTVGV